MSKINELLITNTALASLIGIIFIPLSATVVKAQEIAVLECVKKYTQVGISPDAALAECNKSTLGDCVKRLTTRKVVVKAISESENRYLIDLGDNESRWLEGPAWRAKECQANTQGQYKRQSDQNNTFWGTQRSYEWFRQGFCNQPTIEIEQNYSIEEAKTICELGFQPDSNLQKPSNTP
ncbi:hypothetical protein [Anabaena subtropica]|uniref:Uncharacterized protein n=1 Tax=Anabaena subtropica FACHB-260 TaxID=2692884 RepID=A0ABR8CIJ7_9NOST|nr:hypothetical protein [Anabaena subtropica]MBD2342634.1 hypothetical protein [Anabaena subtropica FACHB-260]